MEGKYQHFKMKELELEADLLHQNFVLYPVYQYCKEKGKKIIITSDMYLPEPFLRNILNKEGYEFDFCFISSSYGVQKVTGNLFKKMLSTVNISAKDVIHIGDSIRSDYFGARKAGIRSILIPKTINNTKWVNLKSKKQKLYLIILLIIIWILGKSVCTVWLCIFWPCLIWLCTVAT